ncbi:hypothetical protein [Natrinema gari]|uniref:Restriction endonuclease n=1 Tax=Natrinema gari JCM 14663 TaxID=1230459 RepID=L9ZAJ0_9EURY|nr:hypothetical protein [Natrinema gari]ELY83424.1 restriction endonuclease [Natrinema gari JCM 14663]
MFYDDRNLEEFRTAYAEMPLYGKAMENKRLVGVVLVSLVVIVGLLAGGTI